MIGTLALAIKLTFSNLLVCFIILAATFLNNYFYVQDVSIITISISALGKYILVLKLPNDSILASGAISYKYFSTLK